MRLVNEQDNGLRRTLHSANHTMQPSLEFAPDTGTRLKKTDVEGEESHTLQYLGYIAGSHGQSQCFGYGRLTHTCLSHQNWIVLPTAHQYVYDLTQFPVSSYDRINPARARICGHVLRVKP
ncbi:hypothetical protein PPNSA23_41960 [Phyllobacterium phragmitis]|uniref:Uncharacterized protein n=1 Tax=Phyllobacterium phragmitis TaxID=2670329 RepID=A0ABQ0H5N8_9HYPH